MTDEATSLLLEIARCPIVEQCLVSDADHDCAPVVRHQWPGIDSDKRRYRWQREHHVPEPWVGHLEHAPILFLSSNPSLSGQRGSRPAEPTEPLPLLTAASPKAHPAIRQGLRAPKPDWLDAELTDRFINAFAVWMPDGVRQIGEGGTPLEPVRFWASVKKLADVMLGRDSVAGVDYALTEVVHCKSTSEIGVESAAKTCVPKYLRRVLAVSPASLIVVLGRHARQAVRAELDYPDDRVLSEPMEIEGRQRRVLLLAHPSARGEARYPKQPGNADRDAILEWLAAASTTRKLTWQAGDIVVTKLPGH